MRPAAPLAGVVVPVYNAAAFLPACLQSIAAQSMQDFRCYLIDDGSADESGALCDSASAADARFCVLHQAQCGVSAARAAGLRAALADGRLAETDVRACAGRLIALTSALRGR